MFKDRRLVIATMHKKEQVIAPILESGLGVKCILPEHFNSDQWGTFSGEIERKHDPIETARQKCLKAKNSYLSNIFVIPCLILIFNEFFIELNPNKRSLVKCVVV